MSDESGDEITDHSYEFLEEACAVLRKHFDTVQIFASRQEPGMQDAVGFQAGVGNFYIRYGQVALWLKKDFPGESA